MIVKKRVIIFLNEIMGKGGGGFLALLFHVVKKELGVLFFFCFRPPFSAALLPLLSPTLASIF